MSNISVSSQNQDIATVSTDCQVALGFVVFDVVFLVTGAAELRAGLSANAARGMAEAVWPVFNQIEVVIAELAQPAVTTTEQAWGVFKVLGIIYKGGVLGAVLNAFKKTLTWYNMILYGVASAAVIVAALATDGVALVAYLVGLLVSFAFLVEDCINAVSACSITSVQSANRVYGADDSANYFTTDRQPSLYVVGDQLYVAFRSASGQTLSNSFTSDGVSWFYPAISINIMAMADAPNAIPFNGLGLVAFPSVYANTTSEQSQVPPASPARLLQLFSQTIEGTIVQGVYMGSPAGMCELNGEVLLAFQASDPSHYMVVTKSADGVHWQAPTAIGNIQLASAPALANFNGTIYCFYMETMHDQLWYITSTDGFTWTNGQSSGAGTSGAPSVTIFHGSMHIAIQGGLDPNSGGCVLLTGVYVENGLWQWVLIPNASAASAPSICAYNGNLYIAYEASDGTHTILYTSSSDGTTWSIPQPLLGVFSSVG